MKDRAQTSFEVLLLLLVIIVMAVIIGLYLKSLADNASKVIGNGE